MSTDYLNYLNLAINAVVGGVALAVYLRNKHYEQQAAAMILMLDIRQAEQAVLFLQEKNVIDKNMKPVLHENNWAKYKHLFARKFTTDDLSVLNRFFDSCIEIAEARRRMNEVFYAAVLAKAELVQQEIFKIPELETPAGQATRTQIIERFNKDTFAFDPNDPKNTIRQHLGIMGRPSEAPVFAKLARIAGSAA